MTPQGSGSAAALDFNHTMANRNSKIDITKGIGIILVVFGHNWIVLHEKDELFRIIFSFHVPLFFFISGIFLRESIQYRSFLLSRTDSLLKPYFVVLVILGALPLLVGITTQGTVDPALLAYFAGMFYGTGATIAWAPMWFLPHLFLSTAFALLILKSLHSSPVRIAYLIAAMLLVVGVYFIWYFWPEGPMRISFVEISRIQGLPWSLDLLPVTTAFVIFGSLLAKRVQSMEFNLTRFLMAIAIFFCLHYFFDEVLDLNLRIYDDLFVSTLKAVIGIYMCFSLSSLLQRYDAFLRPLAYIGSGTLFILIFHWFFQNMVFSVLSQLIANPYLNGIASIIAGIALPLAIWETVKRNRILTRMLLPQKSNTSFQRTAYGGR